MTVAVEAQPPPNRVSPDKPGLDLVEDRPAAARPELARVDELVGLARVLPLLALGLAVEGVERRGGGFWVTSYSCKISFEFRVSGFKFL